MSVSSRPAPSLWTRGALLALVLPSALALTGCQGPCRTLAERICECNLNARERASCIQEINDNGNVRQPTAPEQEVCSELLDSCDCDDLESERFAECGLTKPPPRQEQGP